MESKLLEGLGDLSRPTKMGRRVTLQRVRVNTSSRDTEGRLEFADGELVAVVVRLDGDEHGDFRGLWQLEAGFWSLR